MKLFVELDVSLEKASICVINEHGKIIKEAETGSEPESLACWLHGCTGALQRPV